MVPIEDIGNIYELPNVNLVNTILPQEAFEELYPDRKVQFNNNEIYTELNYEHFLKAVAQFPAFCGEYSSTSEEMNLDNEEQACKRELATLFAHITHETGNPDANNPEYSGMRWLREQQEKCGTCTYHYTQGIGDIYTAQGNNKYKGRGPIHLKWNHMYGMFSKAFYGNDYYGVLNLLLGPSEILDDAVMMFASALWLYMTPQHPHASAHNIMTGFYKPYDSDRAGNDFGTSIIVMSQDQPARGQPLNECDTSGWIPNENALNRASLFNFYCNYFGLE